MMNTDLIAQKIKKIADDLNQLFSELQKDQTPAGEQVVGLFDGEFVVTDSGGKYQVPPNYSSKTMLVPGDKLRLIQEGPQNKFKHIEQAQKFETQGVVVREGDDWVAVCDEGRFRILAASIKHYGVDVGDRIKLYLPTNYKELAKEWQWGAMIEPAEGKPFTVGRVDVMTEENVVKPLARAIPSIEAEKTAQVPTVEPMGEEERKVEEVGKAENIAGETEEEIELI
ncbi:hypothetical protein KKB83_04890 [Patescibacteria group bacterium]|nr:hypothetical protein [Patescibacteria group bacterium]